MLPRRLEKKEIEIMLEIVVDASVVVKWFAKEKEEKIEEAFKVFRLIKKGKVKAWSPVFLLVEVLNISSRKKGLEEKDVENLLDELIQSGISFQNLSTDKVRELPKIVSRYKITAYDALYFLLAKEKKCKIITLDKELLRVKEMTTDLEHL